MVKISKVKSDIKRLVHTVLQSFSLAFYAADIFVSYGVHLKEQDYYIIICCLLTVASNFGPRRELHLTNSKLSSVVTKIFLHFRLLLKSLGKITYKETTLSLWTYFMDFSSPLWFVLIVVRSVCLLVCFLKYLVTEYFFLSLACS